MQTPQLSEYVNERKSKLSAYRLRTYEAEAKAAKILQVWQVSNDKLERAANDAFAARTYWKQKANTYKTQRTTLERKLENGVDASRQKDVLLQAYKEVRPELFVL